MGQRLYQVLLTYCMRWFTLIVGVVYLIVCGFAMWGGTSRNDSQRNAFPAMPEPGPTVNVDAITPINTQSRQARSMFWSPMDVVPPNVKLTEPFPKLVSLRAVGSLKSGDELQVLTQMPNLEGLSLLIQLPPEKLAYLGHLSRLKYLRLLGPGMEPGLRHLRGLSRLQILDISQTQDYTRLFGELRQLKSVTTLILPAQAKVLFQASDWELLRSMPNLRRIYLEGNSSGTPNQQMELDGVQKTLPHVKVRPASVSPRRAGVWAVMTFASCLAWGVLVFQLQSQFTNCGSRLLPNFATAHLGVAVTVWLIANIIQTAVLCYERCDLVASVATSLFSPGILWGAMWLTLRQTKHRWSGFLPSFVLPLGLQSIVWPMMIAQYFFGDLDWFLQGRQPALAWSIIVAGLILPVLVLRYVPLLHVLFQEDNVALPPVGFQMSFWATWNKENLRRRQTVKQPFWLTRRAAQLDRMLSESGTRNWPALWIAGNSFNGQMAGAFVIAMTMVFIFIFGIMSLGMGNVLSPDSPLLPVQSSAWFDMAGLMLLMVWRERRALLGYESLRPVTRQQLIRDWFVAVARDLAPLYACQLLAIAVAVVLQWSRGLSPYWLLAALSCWLFRALTMYAMVLYFVNVRRTWLATLVCFALYFLLQMAGVGILIPLISPIDWRPDLVIPGYLGGCLILVGILVWLKRYWQRVELA